MSLPPFVTSGDIERTASRPNLPDVANMQQWAASRGVSIPTAERASLGDPLKERFEVSSAYLRRQQAQAVGPSVWGQWQPPFVGPTSRLQLLGLTVAAGLVGVLAWSFMTKRPFVE